MHNIKVALTASVALALVMGGCEPRHKAENNAAPVGPSDRAAQRERAPQTVAAATSPTGRRAAVPQFHGKPMWADNRRGTAEENARYQFEHRGADVGATSLDDYLTRVHGFFDKLPKDTETTIRASNGDVLVYSPGANLFGVMRKDGAPRLLMKPPTGRAYWEAQKSGDSAGGDRRADLSAR